MSFAIREQGERKKVAEHIKTITENGADGKPVADQILMDSAKASTLAQLAALPEVFNGVLVIVEGHANENSSSLTVQVVGQKGHF